jgi:hypothetical protein
MSHSEDRIGEIWSTRVQQELLALTTDNADMEATEARSMLPPFTTVKEHTLDIAAGTCVVSFEVDVTGKEDGTNRLAVVVAMDASLGRNADGSVNTNIPSYPFVPPIARLTSGKAAFPLGSTIGEGDRINMDLDWTPSLHLTDAIMNIGLKIRESILQDEPFHPETVREDPLAEAVGEVARGARRFASKIGSLSKAFSPKAATTPKPRTPRGSGSKQKQSNSPKVSTPGDVKIGDEINLLEEPWVAAHGVYSCKAIRRPRFIEEAMASALKKEEQFSSPTSMFRSIAQSARSVMEESFLMVTDTHIIELKASKLNMQMGTVAFCIPIELMAKLKFRRQESLSLFFKTAPDDPLIYMCPDSGDAVHQIQSVLKQKGVRGKHTNAAAYRAINEALQMVQDIQLKEVALDHEPTVARVNEIMDLYRQAAEKFESAGDIRHEEVVTHMRRFLAKPSTISILDGSHQQPESLPKSDSGALEGEVLERTDAQLDCDDDSVDHPTGSTPKKEELAHDREFEDNIDNLLKDVKEDFEKFELDDDDLVMDAPSAEFTAGDGLDDMAADLDAMMKEADKELAELMGS